MLVQAAATRDGGFDSGRVGARYEAKFNSGIFSAPFCFSMVAPQVLAATAPVDFPGLVDLDACSIDIWVYAESWALWRRRINARVQLRDRDNHDSTSQGMREL